MTAVGESADTAVAPARARPDAPAGGGLRGRVALRRYLTAYGLSHAGSAVSAVAVPTLAVVVLHATAVQVAVLAVLGQLPALLVALPAGALADRYGKRPLMIGSDLVCAVAMATIPATAALGILTMGYLFAVALLSGTAGVVHDAASFSYLPSLVDRKHLPAANSRQVALFGIANSGGQSGGGALVTALGAAPTVIIDALSYLASAWWTWRIPAEPARPKAARKPLLSDIRDGLAYVAQDRLIRGIIVSLSAASFATAVSTTYWAYYLLSSLHYTPRSLAAVMAIGSAGTLAGALLAPSMTRRWGPGPVLVATLAILPVTQIPLAFAHPGRTWQTAVAFALFVQMFAIAAGGTTQRSVRQMLCAEEMQGRMQQVSTTAVAGCRPLAAAAAGAVAACAGVRPVFCVAAALLVAPPLILMRTPVARLRHVPPPAPPPAPRPGGGTSP
nr:MFS transporter [Streptomyces sp. NBC_00899]